jgi:hypothetical protein
MLSADYDFDETRSAIRRLAIDPRMEEVWRQLQKRRRREDGAYVHAAPDSLPGVSPVPEARQARAMHLLFVFAAIHFFGILPAMSRSQLEEKRRPLLALSESLRDNLSRLRMLGGFQDVEPAFTVAMAKLERLAEDVGRQYRQAVIDRHRGDPKIRSYLVVLARGWPWITVYFKKPARRGLKTIVLGSSSKRCVSGGRGKCRKYP